MLLVYLVIVPTVLLLLVGIVLMLLGNVHVLFGVLTVSFVLVAVTGIVLVLVFLRREANLSELQADFVSKVSHELRTPLTSIRLFVETMARARGDQTVQDRCLEALGLETQRLTRRIERLLDWGRMEAGRKQFELSEESVAAVIEDSAQAFAPLREQHPRLVFRTDVAPGLPAVHVDRAAMVEAISNLLGNAVKYGGEPPEVTLRGHATASGVAIEVSDNGEGIPRGEHRSGLGLAIVKHIVRAHRGRVQVVSSPGKGSTFRIHLPVAPEKKLAAARTAGGGPSEAKRA
jgi:two-component system, OmpR family, phosphate regulon sensor histidine kinase PhoR